MDSSIVIGVKLTSGIEVIGKLFLGKGTRTSDTHLDVRDALELREHPNQSSLAMFSSVTRFSDSPTPWMCLTVSRDTILLEYNPNQLITEQYRGYVNPEEFADPASISVASATSSRSTKAAHKSRARHSHLSVVS